MSPDLTLQYTVTTDFQVQLKLCVRLIKKLFASNLDMYILFHFL